MGFLKHVISVLKMQEIIIRSTILNSNDATSQIPRNCMMHRTNNKVSVLALVPY